MNARSASSRISLLPFDFCLLPSSVPCLIVRLFNRGTKHRGNLRAEAAELGDDATAGRDDEALRDAAAAGHQRQRDVRVGPSELVVDVELLREVAHLL